MSAVEKVKQFVKTARWYIVGTIVTLGLLGGGLFGWSHYKHINSPEYYLEQLNAALLANDLATLAVLVDFRTITEHMAQQIQQAPIPKRPVNAKEANVYPLYEEIQREFMQALQNKDQTTTTEETTDPLSPLDPLPKDFAAQISGKLQLQAALEDEAILSTTVHYPRLKKDYKLFFLIEKKPDWIMTRLNNIDEILKQYVAEENKLEILREEHFQQNNVEFQKRMDAQFHVSSCTAFLHHVTGNPNATLYVRIKGYNKGPSIIRNMTFATTINSSGEQGKVLLTKDLNMATRILPGVDLEDSYNLELDPNNPIDAAILAAKDLFCSAKPRVMTLGNGVLLYTKRNRLDPILSQ